ncbi:MAG: polyprenyl synthetase family protein [Rhodospirillaceae bacterium]|jgi:farnesyl diphosphate synthase|nr:polyprenyl synthetase family protein [Rhodospirillales bacterium]MBT3907850.1 polyprenyl synthetase family protein [Rhodospirillaceae bacterium]MBT4701758.1 polyprenyl synthetase family protein [Rhodospirillaceae bacterium]MBT5035715.1 polyprenyl synthetase family protein [Rhodospirillaceae bacterium]MBT6218718.1 polyprenyl synthetase family protein [Rhodospirillaceae bacterium]
MEIRKPKTLIWIKDLLLTDIVNLLKEKADAIEDVLDRLLPSAQDPESRLMDAVRYSTLGGGKRIRPFLVVSGAALFSVDERCALRAGAAIEMIHCYSLIHDDLPAMDDDDLRRGQPTCHKKFDEATAILAGDALLTKAFEILGEPETHADPAVRAELVVSLARASGDAGMVGGQMLDLMAEERELDIPEITRLQRLKTGALISFSCEAGGILGKAPEPQRHALKAYAHDLGLAFQIADDLLDVEGTAEEVGKATGKDEAAGKATFVSLLGVERARDQANMLADQASQHLDIFGEKADCLKQLAQFVVKRRT